MIGASADAGAPPPGRARAEIQHGYFTSGGLPLLAHVHRVAGSRGVAALLVAPFGWDEVCSYRSRIALAEQLADAGIAAVRFDAPAVGDSAGDATMSGRFSAWRDSVVDAAAFARAATAAPHVIAIAFGMGTLAAVEAHAAGANLGGLVLWPPTAQGRQLVREITAMQRLEVQEYARPDAEASDDHSVAGFLFAPDFRADVAAVDLTRTIASARDAFAGLPVLTLTRDDVPADARLTEAFTAAGARVSAHPGEGYGAMMGDPLHSRLPDAAAAAIVAFCQEWAQPSIATVAAAAPLASRGVVAEGVEEWPTTFTTPEGGRLFGVWCAPASHTAGVRSDRVAVFLNAGAVRHAGPNRMWVRMARELAQKGLPSLRTDLSDIGESDGAPVVRTAEAGLHTDALVDQAARVIDAAIAQGYSTAGVVGLCSGACWAARVASIDARVDRAVMVNPRFIFWDDDTFEAREQASASTSVLRMSAWRKLVRGRVTPRRMWEVLRATGRRLALALRPRADAGAVDPRTEATLRRLDRPELDAVFVFTEGEPLLDEFERDDLLPPPGMARPFSVVRIDGAGHTLRPLWAQRQLVDLVVSRISAPNPGEAPPT